MKTNLVLPLGVTFAWIVTTALCQPGALAANCPVSLRTSTGKPSTGLPDSSGFRISALVTTEGRYRTVDRGRVRRLGLDSLEFARGYARVSRRPSETGWRADSTWRVSREEVALLFRGSKNRAVAAAKIDHGARICGYVTREGHYRTAEGAAAYRLGNGDLELVWNAGERSGMRSAGVLYRRIVPRDSIDLVLPEKTKDGSNLKALLLVAGVAAAIIGVREATKPKIDIEIRIPKMMPGT